MQQVRETLFLLICQELGVEEVDISDDTHLIEDLNFDSVQLISLVTTVENTFKIEFDDSNMLLDNFNRVGDLCKLIGELLIKKSEP